MNNHPVKINVTLSGKVTDYTETITVTLNVPDSQDEEEYIDVFVDRVFKKDYIDIDWDFAE